MVFNIFPLHDINAQYNKNLGGKQLITSSRKKHTRKELKKYKKIFLYKQVTTFFHLPILLCQRPIISPRKKRTRK
jgi:hypothetical protein